MTEQLLDTIKTLTELHGAPGHERLIRAYLMERLSPLADEVLHDGLGGVFFLKKSKQASRKRVMIAAHMDEVGFMVTDITEKGLLKFTEIGGWPADVLQAQKMTVLTQQNQTYTGVIGSVPKHFRTGNESTPQIKDMLLDVGAESKSEVLEMGIQVGDAITPAVEFEQLTEHRFLCKAWDNRYGCTIIIDLFERLKDVDLPFDLYVGANVQEEVGLRGALPSTNMIQPDLAFVVDCSPANDTTGNHGNGKLGEGTLVRIIDRTMILKPSFKAWMVEVYTANNVAYQYYTSPGGTDGGVIHTALKGTPTAVVGVPARYIHSNHTIFDMRDYYAARDGLLALIKNTDEAKIEYLKNN
ncbi:M42 family metallopeptidase [Macrococcoides caseolyticum]|uniref:M42 family metallopeptidase n=1 Tax=Macrococcoides caseolyticum TaxID=69966 RepID=UPI001F3E0E4E|nr:M42 family metallopeptidase [Macrococcus caseolyticus]MCE4956379.1 M42 family metallopeptidase [Macrococcus caseolyticus]